MSLAEQFAVEDYRLLRDYESSAQNLLVSLMAISVPVGGAVVGAYQLVDPAKGSASGSYITASVIFLMLAALPLGLSGWVIHTSYKIVLCRNIYALIEEHFRSQSDAVRVRIGDRAQLALPSGSLLLAGLSRQRGRGREASLLLRMTIIYGMILYAALVGVSMAFAVVRAWTVHPDPGAVFREVYAVVTAFYVVGFGFFLVGLIRVGRGADTEVQRLLETFGEDAPDPTPIVKPRSRKRASRSS